MSAYQVSRAHVATLALFGEGSISRRFGGLVGLANLLAQANVESLKARYPQDEVEAHEFKNEAAGWSIEDAPKGAPRQISLMGLAVGAYK